MRIYFFTKKKINSIHIFQDWIKKFTENIVKGSLPIAIKDSIDVKGFANTAGSLALKDNYPENNAFLVQKLLDNDFRIW